ncbi:TonB-dependent receptor [Luteimonas sp. RD2P54]|uniref:TonB-dependent receptor n=1 Tax=Luteimonas endophytica TaxID=3042023 RepID=A0ABT6J4T6_9GAMM|nr:TonB-dependent receptor [Luteimonas endophytica]MDH5821779.1 TonB-dependent receptor [Luteimonas endophytica]
MTQPMPRFAPAPLSVALLACLAAPAWAQDARHAEPKDLDAVVVRATPLPQTAEDLARPVEVLTGQRLDEARASSLGETVARLPGTQSSYFGPGVGRPIIRGFDGARVQVLNDGLASGDVSTVSVDHAVSIEPFLANQIEVLKGPATLLYGSGAIGGAVNVVDGRIPEAPTTEPLEGRAELRAGSVADERTGMVRLDGTNAAGNLVFHFDALHRETGDYDIPGYAEHQHADGDEDHDEDHDDHHDEEQVYGTLPGSALRTDAGALGVSWVGERGFLGVGYSLFNTRYGVPGHAHEAHGHDEDDHEDEDEHGHEEPAEDGVHIVMDQRRTELRGGLDQLGGFETLRVKLAHNEYTHTEYEGEEIGTVFDNDSIEGRLELVHQPLAGWDGAFGLQFSRRDFSAVGEEAFVPDSKSRDTGIFWIGERSFGALDLELGARYDQARIDPDFASATAPDRDFDTTSLSAAGRWHLGEEVHLSFGLDRAQRAPTAEELYSDGLHVATRSWEFGDAQLDPETANRAELGLHWHHGPLRLGAAIYHVRYADFIYLADTGVVDDDAPARVWNQADARFTGGELDLQWTFLENHTGAWDLRAFGDIVRGRLDGDGTREVSFSVPHGDHTHDYTSEIALSGNLPRIAPARLGGELRWQSASGNWRGGLGAVRYASQDDVAEYEEETAGYTLVHANLAWHRDTPGGNAWEVFVDGGNLLDREARPHTSFLKELAPLPGRNVSAGLRLFF